MELNSIFYGVGIFLAIITLGYFAGSYLDFVSTEVRVVLSFMLCVILFVVGDILRKRNI